MLESYPEPLSSGLNQIKLNYESIYTLMLLLLIPV